MFDERNKSKSEKISFRQDRSPTNYEKYTPQDANDVSRKCSVHIRNVSRHPKTIYINIFLNEKPQKKDATKRNLSGEPNGIIISNTIINEMRRNSTKKLAKYNRNKYHFNSTEVKDSLGMTTLIADKPKKKVPMNRSFQ